MKNFLYPRSRMYHSTIWQIWAIGWRFVFFAYFAGTLALILGFGLSFIWFVVFIPPLVFYHFLGSSLWNGKPWTRMASIIEHIVIGPAELIFAILFLFILPESSGWKSFSHLCLKVVFADIIIRGITLYYLLKKKDFPQNYINLKIVEEKKKKK